MTNVVCLCLFIYRYLFTYTFQFSINYSGNLEKLYFVGRKHSVIRRTPSFGQISIEQVYFLVKNGVPYKWINTVCMYVNGLQWFSLKDILAMRHNSCLILTAICFKISFLHVESDESDKESDKVEGLSTFSLNRCTCWWVLHPRTRRSSLFRI